MSFGGSRKMQKGTQTAAATKSLRIIQLRVSLGWTPTLGGLKTACCQPPAPNRGPKESTCLLAASLAGSWLALGEADVVLGGLEGLQPPLHVLLEDLLVLPLLRVLQDEVAAAAGFVLAMTAPPCHEAGCLGHPQESQATAPWSPEALPAQFFKNKTKI